MCQPDVADPGWSGGPKLQASGHQVAEVVQGVVNWPSLWDVSADTVDIPEGLAGGTLGDRPWRPADAISGISSAVGFPAPLVEVAAHIRGRDVKPLIDCGSTGNYISDSLVLAVGMEVIPEKDFEVMKLANKTTVKGQGYLSFRLDSGEFSYRVIGRMFPNLRSEVILGTPWLIKENPDIDWVKPEVKMRRQGQIQYLPLWIDRDSNDEADVDSQGGKGARVNMCNAKAFKRFLRKKKQPQAYMAFLRKVNESAMEKVEGEQVLSDVHKIKREGLPEEIWKVCKEYANIFPSDLPKELPPERLGHEFKIDLEPDTKPVHRPIYKLSPLELDEAKKKIEYMLEHSFIQPSESPWGAPVLLHPRKTGAFDFALTIVGLIRRRSGISTLCRYPRR